MLPDYGNRPRIPFLLIIFRHRIKQLCVARCLNDPNEPDVVSNYHRPAFEARVFVSYRGTEEVINMFFGLFVFD